MSTDSASARLTKEERYAALMAEQAERRAREAGRAVDRTFELSAEQVAGHRKGYVNSRKRPAMFEDERGVDLVIVFSESHARILCTRLPTGRYRAEPVKRHPDEYPHSLPLHEREKHPLHPKDKP